MLSIGQGELNPLQHETKYYEKHTHILMECYKAYPLWLVSALMAVQR